MINIEKGGIRHPFLAKNLFFNISDNPKSRLWESGERDIENGFSEWMRSGTWKVGLALKSRLAEQELYQVRVLVFCLREPTSLSVNRISILSTISLYPEFTIYSMVYVCSNIWQNNAETASYGLSWHATLTFRFQPNYAQWSVKSVMMNNECYDEQQEDRNTADAASIHISNGHTKGA